jgi:hypothetical protein
MSEGLSRHDAVHAVGCAVNEHMLALINAKYPGEVSIESYYAAVESLTAERWRHEYGEAGLAEEEEKR